MEANEISSKFTQDTLINLAGFTSTTISKEQALKFALDPTHPQSDHSLHPVLFKITLHGSNQYFNLNGPAEPSPKKKKHSCCHSLLSMSQTSSTTSASDSAPHLHYYCNYSAYPSEQEVLLQEGLKYRVRGVGFEEHWVGEGGGGGGGGGGSGGGGPARTRMITVIDIENV